MKNDIASLYVKCCHVFHLSDAETQLFNQETLQALNRLATSENTEEK